MYKCKAVWTYKYRFIYMYKCMHGYIYKCPTPPHPLTYVWECIKVDVCTNGCMNV